MTIKTGLASLFAILLAACGGSDPQPNAPASPAQALKAGTGIRIDATAAVISVDEAVVPTSSNCTPGQILQRTATGWGCNAGAPDSAMLGGKPASAYMTQQMTAANSAALDGHGASFYLNVNSTAANAALLENHPASDFLAAGGIAANSALLNGHPASDFLAAAATAADSAKLGGQPASFYLAATGTAADTSRLGGVAAASYARADVPAQMRGPLTIRESSWYGAMLAGSISGGDSAGNVHVYANSTGADGRVYLNWFDGNGVRFGNGAQSKVAEIDGSGNLTAASYNGVQVFVAQSALSTGCAAVCASNGSASCVAAQQGKPGTAVYFPALCSDTFSSGAALKCVCAKF